MLLSLHIMNMSKCKTYHDVKLISSVSTVYPRKIRWSPHTTLELPTQQIYTKHIHTYNLMDFLEP